MNSSATQSTSSTSYGEAPSIPLPTGVITLMFTDIEGSSALWERDAAGFRPAYDRHNDIIHETIERWDGHQVKASTPIRSVGRSRVGRYAICPGFIGGVLRYSIYVRVGKLKARDFERQECEALLGCIALNRMTALRMPSSYVVN